jgi:hypothetical protein
MSFSTLRLGLVLPALLLAAACGGGGSDTPSGPARPTHGVLLQNPPQLLSIVTAPGLLLDLSALPNQVLVALAGTTLCDVAVYHLRYTTLGGANEATTASGALMVPIGTDANCHGPRPILLYAHGTSTNRAYNIADLQVQHNAEGIVLAAFFASQGYIVVAPNFAGYDTSTLPYHPFLVADQQSGDMIDALTAARSALPAASALLTTDNGRLFITGYSQGGYVAMATHRAMQAAGMPVTAAAPMSGPYALAAFVDAVFAGRVSGGAPISSTLLITGYQKSFGNIYANPLDVFEARYASDIESLLPGLTPRSTLYAEGKLPVSALFSTTPPAPAYAALTPPTSPASFAALFAEGFGPDNLITNDYRLKYLLDAQAAPDGAWPTPTTGAPAAAPALALRQALVRNDLRDWIPSAPVLLCGGNADPVVYWLNSELMQGYWASRAPASSLVSVLDVDSAPTAGEPFGNVKRDFAVAKTAIAVAAVIQGASDGGVRAVEEAYHAELVAPFCIAAVRSFFASQ